MSRITRLLVRLLKLDEAVTRLDLAAELPDFTAGICTLGGQTGCFTNAARRYEAQLVNLHGLYMRDTAINPQASHPTVVSWQW